MKMEKMPEVIKTEDGAFWKNSYEKFEAQVYVPKSPLKGDILNYGFMAPYLLVFAEKSFSQEEQVSFGLVVTQFGLVVGLLADRTCFNEGVHALHLYVKIAHRYLGGVVLCLIHSHQYISGLFFISYFHVDVFYSAGYGWSNVDGLVALEISRNI